MTTQQKLNDFAPAGLTIRQSTAAGSAHASVCLTPEDGVNFLTRAVSSGGTSKTIGPSVDAPTYLKIVKSGNTIAGYQSANGYAWTLVGKTDLVMSGTFLIGFVTASGADPTLRQVQYTNTVFMRDVPQRDESMALWLRADNAVTVSGGNVTKWVDQGNSAYPATQSTGANSPTVVTDATSGLPVLSFAGGSKWLQLPSNYSSFDEGLSVFVVAKPPSSGAVADARLIDFGNNTSSNNIQLYQPTNTGLAFRVYNAGNGIAVSDTGVMSSSEFRLAEAIHNGNSKCTLYVNGVQEADTPPIHNITNIERQGNFIGKGFGAAAYYGGQIAEILLVKGAVSDERRKSIESYFFYKYKLNMTVQIAAPVISARPFVAEPPTNDTPYATPATGVYASSIQIKITADPLSDVWYSLDGSTPVQSSPSIHYTGPFELNPGSSVPVNIKARAFEGAATSPVTSNLVQKDPNSGNVSRVGVNLWLKADLGVTTSGSNVTQWEDVSGNGLTATQTTSGNRPTFTASSGDFNSQPVINFNGTDQWLQLPKDFSSFPFGASIFVIAKPTAHASNGRFLDFGNGTTTDNIQLYMKNASELSYRVYAGGAQTTMDAPSSLSKQVIEIIQSNTTVTNYNNGTPGTPVTSFNAIPSLPRSGNFIGKANGASAYLQGSIAEIICFNRPVTEDERKGVEAYAFSKYAAGTKPTLNKPVIIPPTTVIPYTEPQTRVFIEAGNNATIYYTHGTNPADPTTASDVWPPVSPLLLSSTEIVKAIAVKSGYNDSPVAISKIVIDPNSSGIPEDHKVLQLRSDTITGVADGGNIATWTNSSASLGNDATQPNAANQPTYDDQDASAANKPAVNFSAASSDWMQFPSTFAKDFTQGMTIFMVAKPTSSTSTARLFDFGNNTTSDNIQLFMKDNTHVTYRVYSGATPTSLDGPAVLNSYQLISVVQSGTTATIYNNGSFGAQSTTMNAIPDIARSGNFLGKGFGAANYFDGRMVEFIVYDKALSDSERKAAEQSLISRYAILPVTPPVINPSAGAWPSSKLITITAADPGATILFDLADTNTPGTTYTAPFTVPNSTPISAKAVLGPNSSTVTHAYIQQDNDTVNLPRDGMKLWLKADNFNGATPDLSLWPDVSGSNNNATQSTSGLKPTRVTNAINSLPAIDFNGTNQWLQLPATAMADFTNGMTAFIVAKPVSTVAANARFFDFGQGATDDNIILSHVSSASNQAQFSVYDGGSASSVTASSAVTTGQFQLLEVNHTGRQAAALLTDGTEKTFGAIKNPKNESRSGSFIGKAFGGAPYFHGQIAEMIIYSKSMLPEERRNVEAYLVGRYGLAAGKPIQPTISPPNGVYTGNQTVKITAFPGVASIKYTVDGTTPSGSSPTYSSEFLVDKSTTIKAIAVGSSNSDVATRTINISPQADPVPRDGLMFWLKSDSALVTASGKVSEWKDVSGSGNEFDASQSDGAKRPLFQTDYEFDRVTTDATPRFLNVRPGFADLSGGLALYIVTRPNGVTGTDNWLFNASNGATSDNIEVHEVATTARLRFRIRQGASGNNLLTPSSTFPRNKFQVLECHQAGVAGTGKIYIDGVQQDAGNMNTANAITRLINRIGANPDSNAEFYSGDYLEILLFNRPHSDAERAAVQNYLSTKYQISNIQTVPAPVIYPATQSSTTPLQVVITSIPGATVYFTQDGTGPTTSSPVYSKPINTYFTQSVKAIAVKNGITSGITTETYTLNLPDSNLWPAPNPSDTSPFQIHLQLPTTAIPQ